MADYKKEIKDICLPLLAQYQDMRRDIMAHIGEESEEEFDKAFIELSKSEKFLLRGKGNLSHNGLMIREKFDDYEHTTIVYSKKTNNIYHREDGPAMVLIEDKSEKWGGYIKRDWTHTHKIEKKYFYKGQKIDNVVPNNIQEKDVVEVFIDNKQEDRAVGIVLHDIEGIFWRVLCGDKKIIIAAALDVQS